MKALTLYQPWASLLAAGVKQIETRPRPWHYQGPVAIHAALRPVTPDELARWKVLALRLACGELMGLIAGPLPLGAVGGIVQMTECRRMTQAWIEEIPELERACGDWRPGRYGYRMEAPQLLHQPVPARGRQGVWNWEPAPYAIDGDRSERLY